MGEAVARLDMVGNDIWWDCCILSQAMGEGEELLRMRSQKGTVESLAWRTACQGLWLWLVICDHRSARTSSGNS